MSDDLLKRLRDNGHSLTQRERSQAAARIEDLERELAAARQIERNVQAVREAEHQRAEKALAELAEADADAERLAGALEMTTYVNCDWFEPLAALVAHCARKEKQDDR